MFNHDCFWLTDTYNNNGERHRLNICLQHVLTAVFFYLTGGWFKRIQKWQTHFRQQQSENRGGCAEKQQGSAVHCIKMHKMFCSKKTPQHKIVAPWCVWLWTSIHEPQCLWNMNRDTLIESVIPGLLQGRTTMCCYEEEALSDCLLWNGWKAVRVPENRPPGVFVSDQ